MVRQEAGGLGDCGPCPSLLPRPEPTPAQDVAPPSPLPSPLLSPQAPEGLAWARAALATRVWSRLQKPSSRGWGPGLAHRARWAPQAAQRQRLFLPSSRTVKHSKRNKQIMLGAKAAVFNKVVREGIPDKLEAGEIPTDACVDLLDSLGNSQCSSCHLFWPTAKVFFCPVVTLGSSPALDLGLEPVGTALVEVGHGDSGDGGRLGSGLGVLALGSPAPGPEEGLQHKVLGARSPGWRRRRWAPGGAMRAVPRLLS
ncbi:unnamed protein product [Rangifer tarandus platyrhynchus]|uniref:Uncharacterized protein n=2 Tax=Rangifer tarandus platyrhynchus TaxID=3082113 RepID=A0ACB0EN30_RANTA|nr:unnamed protein product [Rangifer tarandus platyrhynchus]CAI9701688.1 unnamed protein product [Rangifer tarandus platyrhynchus]